MTVIHKYIARELAWNFCFVIGSVLGIYLAVDFFEKIDNFTEVELPSSKIAEYFLLKIPFILAQTTPVAVLLSALIVLGLMARNNEMVALSSAGVSPRYLVKPLLVFGLLSSVALFFFGETTVPMTTARANNIWLREVKKNPAVMSKRNNVWIKGENSICHIQYIEPAKMSIFGVTFYYFDRASRLSRRVDAAKGIYEKGAWRLTDVIEQNMHGDESDYRVTLRQEIKSWANFSPADLGKVAKPVDAMSYLELAEYVKEVEAQGYDATTHRVNLMAKSAFPLVCFLMALVGATLGILRRRASVAANVSQGIGIAFVYWVSYSFCLSMGYGGVLPPMVAAWLPVVVFGSAGIFAFTKLQ